MAVARGEDSGNPNLSQFFGKKSAFLARRPQVNEDFLAPHRAQPSPFTLRSG